MKLTFGRYAGIPLSKAVRLYSNYLIEYYIPACSDPEEADRVWEAIKKREKGNERKN